MKILFVAVNDYDQYGSYFVALDPSRETLLEKFNEEEVSKLLSGKTVVRGMHDYESFWIEDIELDKFSGYEF